MLKRIPLKWLVAALVLVKGLLFLMLIPPWQGPDEPARLEPAVIIARGSQVLPVLQSHRSYQEEALASMRIFRAWDFYERQVPGDEVRVFEQANLPGGPSYLYESALAYLVPGLTIRGMGPRTVLGELYAARLASLFLHLLTVGLVAWFAGRIFRGSDPVYPGLAVVVMYAMHPQLSFISAVVHPDNLGFLLSAGVMALLLVVAARMDAGAAAFERMGPLLLALALAGISGYVIRKMLVLVFFAVTVIPALYLSRGIRGWTREGTAKSALACIAAAFSFCVVLYEYPELIGWRLLGYPQLAAPADLAGVSLSGWLRYLGVLFATFWLALGSLVNKLSPGWLMVLAVSLAAVFYGWVARLGLRRRCDAFCVRLDRKGAAVLALWLFWVVAAMLAAFGPGVVNPEGRYLLGALLPITVFWIAGLGAAAARPRGILLSAWIALVLLLNAVVLFEYVIPRYYL